MYDNNIDADVDNALAEWDNEHDSEEGEDVDLNNNEELRKLVLGESIHAVIEERHGQVGIRAELPSNSVAAKLIIVSCIKAMSRASRESIESILNQIANELDFDVVGEPETYIE